MKSRLSKFSSRMVLATGIFLALALALITTLANASADPTMQKPIQKVSSNGVDVSLVSMKIKTSRVESTLCIDLPDNTDWFPYDAYLEVGKKQVPVDVIALVNSKNPDTYENSYRCYEFGFPVSTAREAGKVNIVVEKIQTSLPEFLTEEMCAQAQENLVVDHPGFAFSCNIGQQGVGFTISAKPDSMTDEIASQLIVNALTRTVEGPWTLTYNIP